MKRQPKNFVGMAVQYYNGKTFLPAVIYKHNTTTNDAILLVTKRGGLMAIDNDIVGDDKVPIPHEQNVKSETEVFWRVPGTVAPEAEAEGKGETTE